MESDVRDNPAMTRFEMFLGDGALAVAYYKIEDGRVVLLHTEVPQELSGLGYGSRLAHGVFEALRRDGKRVIAKCPLMSSYAARHPPRRLIADGRDASVYSDFG
ncbi:MULTISPECIES: GNAT family N-acetyltransferase [Bradyrhizobium]|uniref:GNAT family N-acetyltransferase n=1 Tax=Bradyrhizobium elkanii TaxID=29448 RepID=UPI000409A39A|nr:GNAT family N-acetyltransferase [Bradyrhizobium elkanii]